MFYWGRILQNVCDTIIVHSWYTNSALACRLHFPNATMLLLSSGTIAKQKQKEYKMVHLLYKKLQEVTGYALIEITTPKLVQPWTVLQVESCVTTQIAS